MFFHSMLFDDTLLLEYAVNGTFHHLATLHLYHGFANAALSDYFQFPLNNIGWPDFDDLKIKISYFNSVGIEDDKEVAVYLDALWLEVNYDEDERVLLKTAEEAPEDNGEVLGAEETYVEVILL